MTKAGAATPVPPEAPEPEELALAAEFATPDRAQWQELVAAVLRKSGVLAEDFEGAPERLLASRTYDGIEIQPLYTAEDAVPDAGFPGLPPFVRGSRPEGSVSTGWDVRALHAQSDPGATNKAVLADLEGGVSSIWLRVGGDALPIDSLSDALNDVYLDLVSVTLDAGTEYEAAAEALLDVLTAREIPAGEASGTLGADPIGLWARTGHAPDLGSAAVLGARLSAKYPRLRTIVVDGTVFHEAGGSDAQELGMAVAAGVAYLRALTDAGLNVEAAAAQLEFRLAAGVDVFLTIAKFRAARLLWARVTEVAGVRAEDRAMHQHAVTSPAMLTRRDPWVNMLRTTMACFAAGIGGADAITVLPFDGAIGLSDAFSRRVARNTHAILLDESKLAGVIDPAGGSWYVEKLTSELARAAWAEFTEIEREGGIETAVKSGSLAGTLADTWKARLKRLATREDPITGVSEFPNLEEKTVERAPLPSTGESSGGLPRMRYAQEYETLRDRSDRYLAEHGRRPRVFLATLGPVAAHTTRAEFAANLFQAGGIETISPGATADVVKAFSEGGTTVACLCGNERSYGEQAGAVAARLTEAGAKAVLLAGPPTDTYGDVTGFVYAGCDALEVLRRTLETLGVQ